MTEEEKTNIKAQALYRFHLAKEEASCCGERLRMASRSLAHAGATLSRYKEASLRVININNKDCLCEGVGVKPIEYPSEAEVVIAFKEYKEAVKRENSIRSKCTELGIAGV